MNRLEYLRNSKNLTRKDLAAILDVTPMTVYRYEKGERQINNKNLSRLSEYFGVSIDYILGNTDDLLNDSKPIVTAESKFAEESFVVPLVASLRCGFGAAGERIFDTIKNIELPPSWKYKYGSDIVVVKAVGESMLPTIRPGDFLISKPGDGWENGMIVVANVEDSDTIKRIYRANDGGIDLKPDNCKYRTMHFTPDDLKLYPPHILGRIVRNYGQDL